VREKGRETNEEKTWRREVFGREWKTPWGKLTAGLVSEDEDGDEITYDATG